MEQRTSTQTDLRSDADLISAARVGDAGAFGTLYERHAGAALVVARQYVNGTSEAEDVVADSFAAVWAALQKGSGPNDAFRAYLFTVVRRTAAVHRDRGRRAEPTDDVAVLEAGSMAEPGAEEPTLAGFERGIVARAFASLPERWQAVLWHSEVEGLSPAEIAPLLGLSANSTAALAYRAREGLRQAYLQQHLAEPLDESHRTVAAKLGAYVRGGLGARDTALVEAHLEECGECRALVLELRDVNRGLKGVIAPLVLGAAGMGALAYPLPTSGGTAAGAASLASGGAAAGAGAAGTAAAGAAEAGAAGGAAAGAAVTGAVGAGAAGLAVAGATAGAAGAAGAAAGVGAAGAAGGGLFAAIGGAIAALPTALVAGIAGLVVVAGAAIGIAQVVGHHQPTASGPSGTTSSTDAGASSPSSGSTPTQGASAAPTPSAPATDPAATPTGPATPADEVVLGTGTGGGSGTTGGAGASTGTGTGSSSAGTGTSSGTGTGTSPGTGTSSGQEGAGGTPTAAPTATPSPLPTAQPTASPEPTDAPTTPPAPGPARLELSEPTGTLDAGGTGQELAIQVSNVGGSPATNLTASVDVPSGVTVTGATGNAGGTLALHAAASGWSCDIDTDGVTCTLPVLDANASARLAVQVDVDEGFSAADGQVVWHVSGAGLDATSSTTNVKVTPAPARLVLAPTTATFVRGRSVPLELDLTNVGGVAADAVVTVTVPEGLTITGGLDDDWVCLAASPSGDVLRCALPGLAPRTPEPSTLALNVTAAESAAAGAVQLTLAPAGRLGLSSSATVPYTLAAPVLGLDLTATAEGVVTVTVAAEDADALSTALTVALPNGLAFAEKDEAWPAGQCEVAERGPDVATCDLGTVAEDRSVTVTLPTTVEAAISDTVTASATAVGAAEVTASTPVGTSSSGLKVRFQSRDQQTLDATQIGAPVLGCDRCGSGQGDNNGQALKYLGATSSTLTLPAGATVEFAGLYWSANKNAGDEWSGDPGTVTISGPQGESLTVTDPAPVLAHDDVDRTYYQSFADVTGVVKSAGVWRVGGVAVSATTPPGDASVYSYYGGWALVVVYDDPKAAPGALTVYDGGAWVARNSEQVFRFTSTPGATVHVGVVGWEGDRSMTGDRALLDGKALTPRRQSGLGSSDNAFDSTAIGWAEQNSLGTDAKSFAPGTTAGRFGTLTLTTNGDQYLLGAVVVRVDETD